MTRKRKATRSNRALESLFALVAKLPERWHLKFSMEVVADGEDEGKRLYVAYLEEEPPEGGWSSWGAYFGHPADWETHKKPAGEMRLDTACRVCITAYDKEAAARLTLGMVRNRVESMLKGGKS